MPTAVRRIDSHAQSVGEVLRGTTPYRVPFYQRDFAWTDEELGAIWEDLSQSYEQDQSEYFLGAIVLSRVADESLLEVVDGQQRLVALSMLFSIISQEWGRRNDAKRELGVFRDFLGVEDRRTGDTSPKLTLNVNNDDTFQQVVVHGEQLKGSALKTLNHSNRLIVTGYEHLKKRLLSWIEEYDDPETVLIEIEEYVAKNTNLIVINVDDDADAFMIFETLNDRGLELAVSDLVKNYLFSKSGGKIEQFQQGWAEVSALVGSEHVTQFLRHDWLSRNSGVVRERDLYRALRKEVKGEVRARRMMGALRSSANLYAALLNPESSAWSQYQPEARNYLEALITFGVTQYRPVALAAMDTLDVKTVTSMLRVLMVASFRYTVVSGLGTGNLERIYAGAALAIREKQCRSAKQLFAALRPIYVHDDKFRADFAARRFSKPPIARYVLAQINDHHEGNQEYAVAESTGRITLEHIMPKNPSAKWPGIDHSQLPEYVDRIGNLTLLEKGKNRGIANAEFGKKKAKAFGDSVLYLNRELTGHDDWTLKSIADRSERLAKTATLIWRVDF